MLTKRPSILKGLHESSGLTVLSLIGSVVVVVFHEAIQILLYFLNRFVELLSESELVELILNGLIERL